jgi:carbon storage regulator
MLYLSRKLGESIIIDNTVEVTVVEVRGKTVKLGFNFPANVTVLRKEIYDKIMAENLAAAQSGADEDDFMLAMDNLNALPKLP